MEDGNEYYATGSPSAKAVMLIPDVFGWNGGRTRNVADFLAERGYYTVVPKLMVPPVDGGVDGDGFNGFSSVGFLLETLKERFPAEQLLARVAAIVDHMKAQGAREIGILGFCWGGWVGSHVLASPLAASFRCCAVAHPSLILEAGAFGKDVLTLVQSIQKPCLWLPAIGDHDEYNEDGAWFLALKANHPSSKTIPFKEVEHGFVPRGDISVPKVKEEVDRALAAILSFFDQHM
jgi:dienelactone hydrolase